MKAASQRRLTPFLVALAALFAGVLLVLALGLGQGVHWNAARPAAPLPPLARAAPLPPPAPLSQFAEVWQKPLFSPDRKPTAKAADGGDVGDLALTGVIITSQLRIALLHDKTAKREIQVVQGKPVPGGNWTLAEVNPRSVLFDAPTGRVELKLPAGAPITAPEGGQDDASSNPDNGDNASSQNGPPQGQTKAMVQQAGQDNRAGEATGDERQRPRQNNQMLQAERLSRLKALIQKRRAEQANRPSAGER